MDRAAAAAGEKAVLAELRAIGLSLAVSTGVLRPVQTREVRSLARRLVGSLRWRKTRLAAHQGLMLWRDVRRMRPGGEGACVTTLLEMPFGAQR